MKANHYKARLIQFPHWLLVLVAVLFLNFAWYFFPNKLDRVKGDTTNLSASQIITLTNQARLEHNLSPLTENAQLTEAAHAKAQNMLSTGNFNHSYKTPTGQIDPWDFITNTGYEYHFAGENLARNFLSSDELVSTWLNSPTHRANLLEPNYQEIGIAVIEGSFPDLPNTVLVVQLLASPLSDTVTPISDPKLNFRISSLLTASNKKTDKSIRYPLSLLFISVAVTIVSGIVLIVDLSYGRKMRVQHVPKHLWRH